jgi:outer membrane protein OmpA-like peptidoglycan-associated protein
MCIVLIQILKRQPNLMKSCTNYNQNYFDLDKSTIRKESALDLAKILDVLIQNPTMKIDIRSHTDYRQTAKYNLALSERRVQSTIA